MIGVYGCVRSGERYDFRLVHPYSFFLPVFW